MKERKCYLVKEFEDYEFCFDNITEIKERAGDLESTLNLSIYEGEMVPLELDAQSILEDEIDIQGHYVESFDSSYIDEKKVQELQGLLDEWSKDIYTQTFMKGRKLSRSEIFKLLEQESNKEDK